MVNAQDYINEKYPHRTRNQFTSNNLIDISNQQLEGNLELNLDNFPNLESLNISDNMITRIAFTSLVKKPKKEQKSKLKYLYLSNNKFTQQDLTCFVKLTSLEELFLANTNFQGSLEPLKNLTKLRKLDISNTDIESGLEYLPNSLEVIYCQGCSKLEEKLKEFEIKKENKKRKCYSLKK